MATLLAGAAYFLVVFAAGVALGSLRHWLLTPLIGEIPAVMAELPIMLTISWLGSAWLIRRLRVPGDTTHRVTMGALAFVLLIAAEVGLGALLAGSSLDDQIAAFGEPPGSLGFAAQVLFALFPLMQRPARRTR